MKIGIASDHAGFAHKEALRAWLATLGREVVDYGCFDEERTDYPKWIRPCAEAVVRGEVERGIEPRCHLLHDFFRSKENLRHGLCNY